MTHYTKQWNGDARSRRLQQGSLCDRPLRAGGFLVFKWMMNEFIIIEIGQKTEQKIFGNKSCYKHCEKAVGIL